MGLIALGAGAANSWTELVAVGLMGTVVVLLSLLWSIGRSGYDVTLTLDSERVTVGDRALGEHDRTVEQAVFPQRVQQPLLHGR